MKPLKIGHVFTIPIISDQMGIGQVIEKYGQDSYYFAIFKEICNPQTIDSTLDDIINTRPLFLALSLDSKIYAGHWSIIGLHPVNKDIPLPAYSVAVGSAHNIEVEDYSGSRRRPATLEEISSLPRRKIVAPVRLEKALRASLGHEPWNPTYEELKAEYILPWQNFFTN